MCPYKRKTGRIGRRQILVFDMCVFTHVMLAIPCKSHTGDLRVLAAIGLPLRTHGAVSGTKTMGADPKKQKNCQGSPMENRDSLLFELD